MKAKIAVFACLIFFSILLIHKNPQILDVNICRVYYDIKDTPPFVSLYFERGGLSGTDEYKNGTAYYDRYGREIDRHFFIDLPESSIQPGNAWIAPEKKEVKRRP